MQSTSAQKLGHNKGYPIGEAKRIEREWKKALISKIAELLSSSIGPARDDLSKAGAQERRLE